jgi:hypothetical protein
MKQCRHRPLMPLASRSEYEADPPARRFGATEAVLLRRATLPWDFVPYDVSNHEQRPAPGFPYPAVLRLQVFSTS